MNYFEIMCAQTGYEPITNFWEEFSLVELNGTEQIESYYNKLWKKYKNSYKEYTELVMVLNWKCWYWHYLNNTNMSSFYEELYYESYHSGLDRFKGEELSYFWSTLD